MNDKILIGNIVFSRRKDTESEIAISKYQFSVSTTACLDADIGRISTISKTETMISLIHSLNGLHFGKFKQ
jgi:hypothetical protein